MELSNAQDLSRSKGDQSIEPVGASETDKKVYVADYYDSIYDGHWFTYNSRRLRERDRDILKLLALKGNEVVIEVGCATGPCSRFLARHCKTILGLDFSPYAIEQALAQAAKEGVKNAEFRVSNASRFEGVADASVDRIAAIDIVEHLDDPTLMDMLRECARVLKPTGSMALYTPNRNHYVEIMKHHNFILKQFPSHIAVRNAEQIEQLVAKSGAPLRLDWLFHSYSAYPLFRWLDVAMGKIPGLGKFFQFRVCMRLTRVA